MPLPLRIAIFLVLGWNGTAVQAAVTCEQLANVAVRSQQLRDQGNSLGAVLAEADHLDAGSRLTKAELDRIKDAMQQAFNGSIRTPLDILQECKDKQQR
jgi:hypothetical protein